MQILLHLSFGVKEKGEEARSVSTRCAHEGLRFSLFTVNQLITIELMQFYCWVLLLTLFANSGAFVFQSNPKFLIPSKVKKMSIRSSSAQLSPLQQAHDAVGGSARVLVASAVAVGFVIRRDPPTYLWVAGAILNAALSKVLKRLINEARPKGAQIADPGMPSSHAMSLFYLAVSVSAAAQEWVPQQSAIISWHNPKLEATFLIVYAIAARFFFFFFSSNVFFLFHVLVLCY